VRKTLKGEHGISEKKGPEVVVLP